MLGEEAVDAKSNEIAAIPLLLERLELKGALVTIDAIGELRTAPLRSSGSAPQTKAKSSAESVEGRTLSRVRLALASTAMTVSAPTS